MKPIFSANMIHAILHYEISSLMKLSFSLFQIEFYNFIHSSLLRTFGFSTTSTYNSYLPLIFGIFASIWGHFWNVRKGPFRGHGGRRGQTASKSKTTKILNQNLLKLDENQNLASVTSKMTSTTSTTSEVAEWIFSKITFLKSVHQAEKNEL